MIFQFIQKHSLIFIDYQLIWRDYKYTRFQIHLKRPVKAMDLGRNPVFIKMQSEYGLYLSQAAKNDWVVCIPHAKCLEVEGVLLDARFIRQHVLKKSPFFNGEYLSLDGAPVQCKGDIFSFKRDFKQLDASRIVSEGVAYTEELEKIRIIILSKPFCGPFRSIQEEDLEIRDYIELFESMRRDFRIKIKTIFENNGLDVDALAQPINRFVKEFHNSYLIVKGFELHAADKVRGVVSKCLDEIPDVAFPSSDRSYLHLFIQEFVQFAVHDKIMDSFTQMYETEDLRLSSCIGLSIDSLALPKEFKHNPEKTIGVVSELSLGFSPLSKMIIIVKIARALESEILSLSAEEHGTKNLQISSDELLPLFALVLSRSSFSHIYSSIIYIENLYCSDLRCAVDLLNVSEMEFYFATFKAAALWLLERPISVSDTKQDKACIHSSEPTNILSKTKSDQSHRSRIFVFPGERESKSNLGEFLLSLKNADDMSSGKFA